MNIFRLFLSPILSDSLLILDDVWKPEVIKIFTLPVRILVTTQVKLQHSFQSLVTHFFQDVSVMDVVRDHYSIVEIR
jgi:hypothetical protein